MSLIVLAAIVTDIGTYSYFIIPFLVDSLVVYTLNTFVPVCFPFTFQQNEVICDKLVIVVLVFEGVTLEKQCLVCLK